MGRTGCQSALCFRSRERQERKTNNRARYSCWLLYVAGRRAAPRIRCLEPRVSPAKEKISGLRCCSSGRQILSRARWALRRPKIRRRRQEGPRGRRLQGYREALMFLHSWTRFFPAYPGPATPAAFRLLCAAVSGAALSLSYTGFYFAIYSWLCIGLLLVVILDVRPRIAFACGFVHTLLFVFTSVPWIATVLAVHGGLSRIGGWAILFLIALVIGTLTGSFAWCVRGLAQRSLVLACVGAPFLWVTFEFALAHLPEISFPWNLLGYPASANLALLQLSTITGIWGLSFVVAAFNALLAWTTLATT